MIDLYICHICYMSVRKWLAWQPHYTFMLFVSFHFILKQFWAFMWQSGQMPWVKMHSCMQHACRVQTLTEHIYGGKLFFQLTLRYRFTVRPHPRPWSLPWDIRSRHPGTYGRREEESGRGRQQWRAQQRVRMWPYCFQGHPAFPFSAAAGPLSPLRLHV